VLLLVLCVLQVLLFLFGVGAFLGVKFGAKYLHHV
jgi:hypothetical protein